MNVKKPKKPNYKKDSFDQITDPWERRLEFVRSVGEGVRKTLGHVRQQIAFNIMKASGRYKSVTYGVKVPLKSVGHRVKHEIDILCVGHNGDVELYNVKSRTHSNTDDPHDTVRLPVAARDVVQREHPDKRVTYQILRLGGGSLQAWDDQGITTVELNQFLSDLAGHEINVEQEETVERQGLWKKTALRRCDELGVTYEYGISVLRENGVPADLLIY